ncbi:hypothetical protein HN51_061677, partial [Arachis hypogaea]
DMAACSGFGWDNVKQCVVMDNKEILVAYLMSKWSGCCKWQYANDAEEKVQKDGDEEMDDEEFFMFNSNYDFSESLPQQSNSMASFSERKQGKKPHPSKATKDTNMMKELTETLKYVFDQQGKRLDAFAQTMINTYMKKKRM